MAPPNSRSEDRSPALNNTRPKATSKMTFHGYGLNEPDSNECQDSDCKFNPTKHTHTTGDTARSVQHPDRLVVPGHRNDGPHDLSKLFGGGTPTGRGSWSFGGQKKKRLGPVTPPLHTEATISSLADLTLKNSTKSHNESLTTEVLKLGNKKEIALGNQTVTIANLDVMLLKVMAEKSNPNVNENLQNSIPAKTDQMKAGKISSQAGESAADQTEGKTTENATARAQWMSDAPTQGFGSMESGMCGLDGMNEEASQDTTLHKFAVKDLGYGSIAQNPRVLPDYLLDKESESGSSEQKAGRRRWY